MVPSVWVVVDGFAFNSAGRLDRRALRFDFGFRGGDYVAPSGEAEWRWRIVGVGGFGAVLQW